MKKVSTVSKLKKDLWKIFSLYIRTRDALKIRSLDKAKCYTCDYIYPIKKMQAGHFIPGRRNGYLFHEDQVHAQCFRCNINLKGNWPVYLERMREDFGKVIVEEMIKHRRDVVQFKVFELLEKIEIYKEKLKKL